MNDKFHKVPLCLVFLILMVFASSFVQAANDWHMLEEKDIKAVDQGVSFENENLGRIKKIKLSVEDADLKIRNLTLKYRMRRDDEFSNFGVLKAGGQITPIDLPGARARVRSVILEYEILGGQQSARVKLWGVR